MIEVYVLATLVAMGYLLNKTSKPVDVRSKHINTHELPSQDTIYNSTFSQQVDKYEKQKASRAFIKAQNPVSNNVIAKNYIDIRDANNEKKQKFKSLTGEYIDAEHFIHNNMVPFFGGNVKQNMSENSTKSILGMHTGLDETYRNKQEVKCFGDKVTDYSYVNGIDNKTDFYKERFVESKVQNNVVPIPQIRVGPGVGQGYDDKPIGGFQQLDMQELIKPYFKGVDELRVATKPKLTFEGRTVEGQKGRNRADVPNLAKNRVDTFYEQTPDMLFKTTGAFTKPTEIPEFNVKTTNRNETSTETIGGAKVTVPRRKVEPDVKPTARQQMSDFGLRNFVTQVFGNGEKDDYGKSSIYVFDNERDLTCTRVYQGNVTSMVKSIVAPLMDIMRINKKEHDIDNPRHFGNMHVQAPQKPTMYDPNDIARTTIKETLLYDEMGMGAVTGPKRLAVYDPEEVAKKTVRETLERLDYELNLHGGVYKGQVYDPDEKAKTTLKEMMIDNPHDGNIDRLEGLGTYVNDYMAKNTQKQFTSDYDYYGVAGPNYKKKDMSREDKANAVISGRKEAIIYGREPTKTSVKVATTGEMINVNVKKLESDVVMEREFLNVDRKGNVVIPTTNNINLTKDRKDVKTPDNRLDPDLLKAFVDNPYTHSLHSF